ncbi:MAG: hypothetical protein GC165_10010 [Armatimonadetes bacterium]|nr:hypothetical protein [Armatimonadota bacterium]
MDGEVHRDDPGPWICPECGTLNSHWACDQCFGPKPCHLPLTYSSSSYFRIMLGPRGLLALPVAFAAFALLVCILNSSLVGLERWEMRKELSTYYPHKMHR